MTYKEENQPSTYSIFFLYQQFFIVYNLFYKPLASDSLLYLLI